jgi:hypothetical protein
MWWDAKGASTSASLPLSAARLTWAGMAEAWILSELFGGPFSTHARRVAIWGQAAPIPGCDKSIWRCDERGRVIRWADFDDRFSRYGWTIAPGRDEGWLVQALGLSRGKAVHVHDDDQAQAA